LAAFERGAWVGGLADSVYSELVDLKADAVKVADGVEDEFTDAAGSQPINVEPDAWQVHWRNYPR